MVGPHFTKIRIESSWNIQGVSEIIRSPWYLCLENTVDEQEAANQNHAFHAAKLEEKLPIPT
jgi:hypothetical protein